MDLGEKRGGDVYHEGNIIFLTKDSADKFANEVRTLINDMRSEQQQDNSQKRLKRVVTVLLLMSVMQNFVSVCVRSCSVK